MNVRSAALAALLVVCAAAAPVVLASPRASAPATTQAQDGRVIVLGFDGADSETAEALMDAGELPNLARLRETGTFAGLRSTAPPESPTAWASLNSGQNPAKTGIPGFVRNRYMKEETRADDASGAKVTERVEGTPGKPGPTFGHVEKGQRPLAEIADAPIPTWGSATTALAGFGLLFVGFFLLFGVLLRLGKGVAFTLSLLLGFAGGWGGLRVRSLMPEEFPVWMNPLAVDNFWDHAARAGVDTVVIDAVMSFDREAPEGARVLSGLGLPDARNGLGEWCIYTTNPLEFDGPPHGTSKGLTAGTIYKIDERDGKIETELYGPVNFWLQEELQRQLDEVIAALDNPELGYQESFELQQSKRDLEDRLGQAPPWQKERASVPLVVVREAGSALVSIGGQEQTLREGEWSDWYHVTYDLNPLLKVNAVTRVKIVHLAEPHFELLVNVLDIDPSKPIFWQPVSSPIDYSAQLAEACGPYETYGWPSLTMPFKDEKIDATTMLEDLEFTMKWRERLVHHAIDQADWRLFFGVFSITDRVQHMMYQFYDEGHPQYDAERAATPVTFFGDQITYADAIPHVYRQMDRIVGDVMAKLRPDDTLLLVADHGFESFRYQVHLNNWLEQNGYLTMLPGGKTGALSYIDWERTRAYALGLGFIYVNVEGREEGGIVVPSEKRAVMDEIREKLLAMRNPERPDDAVIEAVYVVEDEHQGALIGKEADLVVGFGKNYRVSWRTSEGGIKVVANDGGTHSTSSAFEDNDSPWSGDHISVNLDRVKGIFFCNRKVELPAGGPDLLHVAPTVLSLLDVPIPAEMDLPPLAVGP